MPRVCSPPKHAMNDVVALIRSLAQLRAAEAACTRCPLYKNATQVVPGEGPVRAHVLVVGEQPGDKEDLAGKPFVGPAGRVLDQALNDAGVRRTETFRTNAVKHFNFDPGMPRNQTFLAHPVKHFKFEPRGKPRLHKKPNAYEIDRCRWWTEQERAIVKPELIVALGATAARSLLGRAVTITKLRGEALSLSDGTQLLVTIHP